jgi:hypothetical protein
VYTLPSEVSQLSALETLALLDNTIVQDSLPSLPGSLQVLELFNSNFEGPMLNLTNLPELVNLTGLYIAKNQRLSQSIPTEISRLTALKALEVYRNPSLTGSIPSQLGELTNLSYLTIDRCSHMRGSIPPQLGMLIGLKKLKLEALHCTGSIPTTLSNLQSLTELALMQLDSVTGGIPAQLGALTGLEAFRVVLNSLSGPLPLSLAAINHTTEYRVELNAGTCLLSAAAYAVTGLQDSQFPAHYLPCGCSALACPGGPAFNGNATFPGVFPDVPLCCVSFDDIPTTLPSSSDLTTSSLFFVIAVLLLLFVIYLILRAVQYVRNRELVKFETELVAVIGVLISFFDFATDIIFILDIKARGRGVPELMLISDLAVASLAACAVVNGALVVRELYTPGMLAFWRFFHRHQWSTTVIFLVSLRKEREYSLMSCHTVSTNVRSFISLILTIRILRHCNTSVNCSLFTLIGSRLLSFRIFSAPVNTFTRSRLQFRGIGTTILEDVPQLIMQSYVASHFGYAVRANTFVMYNCDVNIDVKYSRSLQHNQTSDAINLQLFYRQHVH